MRVRVKYRLQTIDVEFDGSGSDLRRVVEAATLVPVAKQKLVAKGKVLGNDINLKDGTVIMLLEQSGTGTYGSRVPTSTSQSRGQVFQKTLLKTRAAIKRAITPDAVLKAKDIEERVEAAAKLNYLALNGVNVGSIPAGAFDRSLTRIELVNCSFPSNCRLFSSPKLMGSLKKLVLNGCQLKDGDEVLHAISGLKNLAHLELKGNKLSADVPKLDQPVKTLDLSRNELTGCGTVPLMADEIYVGNNRISTLDLRSLARCRVVVARGNLISNIVTAPCSTIEVLDVRDNWNLSKLPDAFFCDLDRLVQLELGNTAIVERELEEMTGYKAFAERSQLRKAKRYEFVREYDLQ